MARVLLGAVIAAVAMFFIGFIFYASGIQNVAFRNLDNSQAATVQQALAANLPPAGAATYVVPDVATPEQTAMYGKGPIATIHYNSRGFPAMDGSALVGGFVLDLVVALLIGAGLLGLNGARPGTAERAAVLFAIAAAAYIHLKEPLFFHHDWPTFIFSFIADAVTLGAAGLIIARWFLPRAAVATPAAADPL